MAYTVPQFNLLASIWRIGQPPSEGFLPLYDNVPYQAYYNSRVGYNYGSQIAIRTPKDMVRQLLWYDIWEAPRLSGRYWITIGHARVHEGFVNEYFVCTGFPTDNAGVTEHRRLP